MGNIGENNYDDYHETNGNGYRRNPRPPMFVHHRPQGGMMRQMADQTMQDLRATRMPPGNIVQKTKAVVDWWTK